MSTPPPSDGKPQTPVDGNSQDVKAETVNDTSDRPFSVPSQPLREDQVQNAVNFLSHPRVKGSPVIYRRSFLEKKGLTREEIDEAFRRFPDPPSNATTVETTTTNQAVQPKSSTSVQAQAPIQTPQTAAAPVSIASVVPSSQQSKFQWSHALIAVGVLSASGAGTAVFFKNVVVPRLKTWILKVVAEKNESEEDKPGSVLAEQTAEAAKAAATAAASAAAIAAKASEDLLNSKTEEKKYFEAFMGMMDVQVKELKTMGEAIRKLESTKENSSYQDKLVQEYIQSTIGNGTTNNSWGKSQQAKVNGTPNADNGAVRPSSAPVNAEPATAPHPKSYMEIMAMVQRGEKPPNVRDIDDMPPNPNQQIAKPLLAPRPKPWEVPQQKPSYGLQSQPSAESLGSESSENGLSAHSNGKAGNVEDASEPWWRRKTVKITEIEPEAEETRQQQQQFPYNFGGADGRPIQRGWVPPQPPTVAIPESAAAIRQPKSSSIQKQPSSEMPPSDNREDAAASSSAPQDSGVEPEASGSAVTESNISEIEEERGEGGVEVY